MPARNSDDGEGGNPKGLSSMDIPIIDCNDQSPGKFAVAGSISEKVKAGGQKWQ